MIKILNKEDKYMTIIKIFGLSIITYILYLLITGVFIFIKTKKVSQEYISKSSVSDYYNDEIGPDRAIIIDDPLESGIARLKIIENTKKP